MKLVKLLSKPEEEGRFFGILDGGRGLVEAVLASIAVVIFSGILGTSTDVGDKQSALIAVIYMYTAVLIIVAVLIAIFVESDKKIAKKDSSETKVVKERVKLSDFGKVFKNKLVYILGGIIFMSYCVTWTLYYFGGFLETNIGVSPVTVGVIMVVVLWMRPVGGILGGFLADKFGKAKTLGSSIVLAGICLVLLSILPVTANEYLFYALVIAGGLFIYAIRGTYWSLFGDCQIENNILGAAIGVISVFGYLPDIVLPIFNSSLFNTFGPNGGYNAYFISCSIIGVVGVVLIIIFRQLSKNRKIVNVELEKESI